MWKRIIDITFSLSSLVITAPLFLLIALLIKKEDRGPVFYRGIRIVGPRPEVPFYVGMMTKEEREKILSVKPGITDLASLWDIREEEVLKGSSDPEKTYQEKIRPTKLKLQKEYVENRSLWLDLKIIAKTIFRIFPNTF